MKPEHDKPTLLMQAIDLKKHYPVKKGCLASSSWSKRLMAYRLTWSAAKRWR